MSEVPQVIEAIQHGDPKAAEELLPLVYGELRKLAAAKMANEAAGNTLQPTALVHEAYLRLAGQDRADWRNRAQFIAIAGQLMRRILVDHARKHYAAKRVGSLVTLKEGLNDGRPESVASEEILAVDQALESLSRLDPRQVRIIELRYFCGLSTEETAEAIGISERSVAREWALAKAWLRTQLAERTRP